MFSNVTCFILLKIKIITNYADDSIPYNVDKNIEVVIDNVKYLSSIFLKWFNNNYLKVNTGKSHLLVSRNVRAMAKIGNNYNAIQALALCAWHDLDRPCYHPHKSRKRWACTGDEKPSLV